MSRSSAILIMLTAALFTSACQSRTETSDTTTRTGTTAATVATSDASTTAPASDVPYDLQFIDTMAKHHEGALAMLEPAAGKATHAGIREAAGKMLADQKSEIAELKAWRDQWYPGAAGAENMQMPGMSSMSMDMHSMKTMEAGPAFDLMFIDMMVPHHQGAIVMAQDALSKTERPELRAFAQKVIDSQTKEIEQMNGWKTELQKR